MQMKAVRDAYFFIDSSSTWNTVSYWLTSISAGTPAGYCLSHCLSIDSLLCFCSGEYYRSSHAGAMRLQVGVVAGADQRRRRGVAEAQGGGFLRVHGEGIGVHIAQHRQMMGRGGEVLA